MRALLITLALATLTTGCIGAESSEPPVVGIRNMYNQPRYDTQERQPFFADQRSMRPQVPGTVSRETDPRIAVSTGRRGDGKAAEDGREGGAPDGIGWSMSVVENSGNMVLTASGDGVAFVIFGACTSM